MNTIATYLNNHLVDETLALELAARAASEHEGTRLGTFLELLSWELEEDRDSLVRLMGELGVRRRPIGAIFAKIADRALHHRLTTLAQLESLDLRIHGKLDMWHSLRAGAGDRVGVTRLDALIRRTEGQAWALKQRRQVVAAEALDYDRNSVMSSAKRSGYWSRKPWLASG